MNPNNGLVEVGADVYTMPGDTVYLGPDILKQLKIQAKLSPRSKARILLHSDSSDVIQQMLIVHLSDPPKRFKYNQPHLNINNPKTYHILEGSMRLAIFNDSGELVQTTIIEASKESSNFMVRMNAAVFHTVIPLTESVVYLEIVKGPYKGRIDAEWAATDEFGAEGQTFVMDLLRKCETRVS